MEAANGCYEAGRAAALSGVPRTTVYWWAKQGIVVPSVSPTREKLWSYSDLMALRIVSWLRHPKAGAGERPGPSEWVLPASPMPRVRRALDLLGELGLDLWTPTGASSSPLLVDGRGDILVRFDGEVLNLDRQPTVLPDPVLGLTAPFRHAGGDGPDLLRPRAQLRIMPAKVAGEPHIAGSRVTTQTVAALAQRGFATDAIAGMYGLDPVAIAEALDLERQLSGTAVAA